MRGFRDGACHLCEGLGSPPIRIAFVSHVFWPERRRGGERLIRDLSTALIARGHEALLVTSHRGAPSEAVEDELRVIRQRRWPERPFNRLGLPPGTSHLPAAWREVRRLEVDVVQAWTAPAAIAAARSGKPSVFVFQGVLDEADLAGRPRVRAMLMRAARECNAVTAYSEVAADAFERITGIEARAIEPGIDLRAFTPGDAGAAEAAAAAPVIFCAADPGEARKRVGLLVDAFRILRSRRPEAELWLMPGGPDADGVRVVDPGSDRDALVDLYRSALVTVLPSFREAFGLVVVESLACGTPVVGTSDGGAVPSLIEPAHVADPDPESLAATIERVIDTPPTAAACRARAERYSIDRCAERYESLYEDLLARRAE